MTIAATDYAFKSTGRMGPWERMKDTLGGVDSVLANDNVN